MIITSRARRNWLGNVRRITVDGLNRAEAAQYASHLLAPYPTAQRRRERRSFGELLEWLDGHPLAMRLTLPRLDSTDPAVLLAELRGTDPAAQRGRRADRAAPSLAACITYSFTHLGEQTRRLLPAVSPLCGTADETLLGYVRRRDGHRNGSPTPAVKMDRSPDRRGAGRAAHRRLNRSSAWIARQTGLKYLPRYRSPARLSAGPSVHAPAPIPPIRPASHPSSVGRAADS